MCDRIIFVYYAIAMIMYKILMYTVWNNYLPNMDSSNEGRRLTTIQIHYNRIFNLALSTHSVQLC